MAIESAIFKYTKDNITLVDNRVHAVLAPKKSPTPYLVYNIVSNNFNHAMGGDDGLCQTTIQFNVYGKEYEEVKEVIEQIKKTYRNYIQGDPTEKMSNESWVQATLLNNEMDMYEDETNLYHSVLGITFWHKEEDE